MLGIGKYILVMFEKVIICKNNDLFLIFWWVFLLEYVIGKVNLIIICLFILVFLVFFNFKNDIIIYLVNDDSNLGNIFGFFLFI